MNRILTRKIYSLITLLCIVLTSFCGCGQTTETKVESQTTTTRSNASEVLVPELEGDTFLGTENFKIDITNASEGYFVVDYEGENPEVRLQAMGSENITYTYIIHEGKSVIPLSQDSGQYTFTGYEALAPGEYAVVFSDEASISIDDSLKTYLYPNMYVDFTEQSEAVGLAKELASGCTCDLEVIGAVYNYVIENIVYDHELAENVQSDYLPDVDRTLDEKKGICFDYASLMAAMLRSQRIPTRLEIGYAGTAYHAWISTYIEDIGWVNGVARFDGTDWTLMDPTFAANTKASELKSFIGDGDNYVTKYVY